MKSLLFPLSLALILFRSYRFLRVLEDKLTKTVIIVSRLFQVLFTVWTRRMKVRLLFVMWRIRIKAQPFVLPIPLYSPVQLWPFPIFGSVKQAPRELWEQWKDGFLVFVDRFRRSERCWVLFPCEDWWRFCPWLAADLWEYTLSAQVMVRAGGRRNNLFHEVQSAAVHFLTGPPGLPRGQSDSRPRGSWARSQTKLKSGMRAGSGSSSCSGPSLNLLKYETRHGAWLESWIPKRPCHSGKRSCLCNPSVSWVPAALRVCQSFFFFFREIYCTDQRQPPITQGKPRRWLQTPWWLAPAL